MSDNKDCYQVNSTDWMKKLRDKLVIAVAGNEREKIAIYMEVGYCYQCYAPASLYKYYGGGLRDLEAIKNNKMWFSAPCVFNDVFDCDVMIDEEKLFESIKQMCPSIQGMRIGSPMWKKMRAQAKDSKKGLQKMFEQMRTGMGITCLSESDDSLLMWAHYAKNHRGMCMEYDLLEINQRLKFTPVPVIYSDERVCFDSLHSATVEKDMTKLFIESLTSKSPEWSYEKEWRIIRDEAACGDRWNSEKKGALLDAVRPRSVILGCMVEAELEKAAHEYCEKEKIDLYKMRKDDRIYRLVKEPVLQFEEE